MSTLLGCVNRRSQRSVALGQTYFARIRFQKDKIARIARVFTGWQILIMIMHLVMITVYASCLWCVSTLDKHNH